MGQVLFIKKQTYFNTEIPELSAQEETCLLQVSIFKRQYNIFILLWISTFIYIIIFKRTGKFIKLTVQ